MKDVIEKSLKTSTGKDDVSLEFPENDSFGDFSTNIALHLEGNPKEEAEKLVGLLKKDPKLSEIVSKIEVAGPGFINFFLSQKVLASELKRILEEKEAYGSSKLGEGKTVVIDYSSPNIAKRFGIGHLRSTVIGQAIYNLYQALGYKTIGDNHLGDWGTQFGTLLYQITSQNLDAAALSIDKLEELYVDFHQKEAENPELHEEAKKWFKKLEEGDSRARQIWEDISKTSLAEFNRIYELLKVKIDHAFGESFYEDKMSAVIAELEEKGLLIESEGAKVVELAPMPPAIIIKSDDTTTYFTRDLATIKYRLEEWNPDISIYEVGVDQALHFRQLFAAAKLLGWTKGREFVHIPHGLIRFEHGKMSTRRGQTVKLEEVLEEAITRARAIIEKSKSGRGLTEGEGDEVAKAVGIGAIKYFDLSHHPQTDIIFDWNKIFVLQGNSAPYLQYTVARTNSVLAKAPFKGGSLQGVYFKGQTFKGGHSNLSDEEIKVLRSLARFSDVITTAAKSYSPNLLANYLFDLAQKYNNFYNSNRIIGSDNEAMRVQLTAAVGQVLKNGLTLLGIETPERM